MPWKEARRGLKAEPGRGSWKTDRPPIIVLVERKKRERYVPSTDAEGETIGRIASRHVERGSHIHTDGFPSYPTRSSKALASSMNGKPFNG